MAGRISWDGLTPIGVNPSLSNLANDSFNQGISTLANAVRGFAQDARDQNTNALLQQVAGINNLSDLDSGKATVQSLLQSAGNGADSLKVLDALSKQENSLFTRQNNLNALAKYDRDLVREQGQDSDRRLMNDPVLAKQLLDGDAAALNQLPNFYDGSGLIRDYAQGRNNARSEQRYAQERQDRLKQQNFSNTLAIEDQNIQTAKILNPNPGETTTRIVDDGKGGFIEQTVTTPSLASTLATVAANRRSDGSLNWGSSGGATTTSGQPVSKSIQSAVASNLKSLSTNLRSNGELAQSVNRLNIRDPKVLAMMAVESGGGGMNTSSYNGSSVGPMQLNKQFAADMAKKYGISGDPLTNIDANIRTGQAFINDLSQKFNGNAEAIGIGYNGGEAAARTAYNAWMQSGQKGNVRDYIPSTYKDKNGNTRNYDVKQMRDHAMKFDAAYSHMSAGSRNSSAAIPSTIARSSNTAAGTGSGFTLGGNLLQKAQQDLQTDLTSNQQMYNTTGRKADTVSNKNALELFLEDNKIRPNGSAWSSLLRDSQNTYDLLKQNPEFNKLNAADQKSVLSDTMSYVKNNQGVLGINPADGKTNKRANMQINGLIASKIEKLDEQNYSSLRKAAQSMIDTESKRKNRSGPLPTLDQAMRMINPELYNSMRAKDREVNNPF